MATQHSLRRLFLLFIRLPYKQTAWRKRSLYFDSIPLSTHPASPLLAPLRLE